MNEFDIEDILHPSITLKNEENEEEIDLDDEYQRLSDIWSYPIQNVSDQVDMFKKIQTPRKSTETLENNVIPLDTQSSISPTNTLRTSKNYNSIRDTLKSTLSRKSLVSVDVTQDLSDTNGKELESFIKEFSRRCEMYPGRKPLISDSNKESLPTMGSDGERINQLMAISMDKLVQNPRGITSLPQELSQALITGTMKSLSCVVKRSLNNDSNAWLQLYASIDKVEGKKQKLNILQTYLKSSPLFKKYSSIQIQKISLLFEEKAFIKDSIIIEEGELGSTYFIIIDGYINKYVYDPSKQENTFLGIMEPGDSFCYEHLFRKIPAGNTYRGSSDGLLLMLSRNHFLSVLAENENIDADLDFNTSQKCQDLFSFASLVAESVDIINPIQKHSFITILNTLFLNINTPPPVILLVKNICELSQIGGFQVSLANKNGDLEVVGSYGYLQDGKISVEVFSTKKLIQQEIIVMEKDRFYSVNALILPISNDDNKVIGTIQVASKISNEKIIFPLEEVAFYKQIGLICSAYKNLLVGEDCIYTKDTSATDNLSFKLVYIKYKKSEDKTSLKKRTWRNQIQLNASLKSSVNCKLCPDLSIHFTAQKGDTEYLIQDNMKNIVHRFDVSLSKTVLHSYIYITIIIDGQEYKAAHPIYNEYGYMYWGNTTFYLTPIEYFKEHMPITWNCNKSYGSLVLNIQAFDSPIKYTYDSVVYPTFDIPLSPSASPSSPSPSPSSSSSSSPSPSSPLHSSIPSSLYNPLLHRDLPFLDRIVRKTIKKNEIEINENSIDIENILRTPLTEPLSPLNQCHLLRYLSLAMNHELALFRVAESMNYLNINETKEIYRYIALWPSLSLSEAFLCLSYRVLDPIVRQKAVQRLYSMSEKEIELYMLQLVQALKYEYHLNSPLSRFLLYKSINYPSTIGYAFFWQLKSQTFDPFVNVGFSIMLRVYINYSRDFSESIGTECFIISKLMQIADSIRKQEDPEKRQKYLTSSLSSLLLPIIFSLPTSPSIPLTGINIPACKVMKSKKRPLFIEFNRGNESSDQWMFGAKQKEGPKSIKVIVKTGDDLRQDQIVLKIFKVFDTLWKKEGLDLLLNIYNCIPTGDEEGLLEVVQESETVGAIYRESREERLKIHNEKKLSKLYKKLESAHRVLYDDYCVLEWLIGLNHDTNTGSLMEQRRKRDYNQEHHILPIPEIISEMNKTGTQSFSTAAENFAKSCAGYCVATYVLGIGDRHNDNIMIKTNGQLFHIDFGHILGHFKQKFGIKREKSPFIFTKSFAKVLGPPQHPLFKLFVELCCKAYLCLRRNSTLLYSLFELLYESGLPEIESEKDLKFMMDRLELNISEEEAVQHIKQQIAISMNCKMTLINDVFHLLKN
ncbi:hypothetical protein WA158_001750 [Blastocystis sp. Blastoise]